MAKPAKMQNLVSRTPGWAWPKVIWMNMIIFFWFLADKSHCSLQHVRSAKKSGDSLNFLVVGDWGRKGYYNQSEVATQMGRIGEKLDIDFVISTGDNFYENGLTGVDDPSFEESFSGIYTAKSLQIPWYSVLGNHDYRGNALAQLSPSLRSQDHRWQCERSFILRYTICQHGLQSGRAGSADLFFVDTSPFVDHYWQPSKNTYDWRGVLPREKYLNQQLQDLSVALETSTATWKIVIGHHTIRSVGSHGDTEEMIRELLPVIEAYGVDLYVNGHDHCLEHISSVNISSFAYNFSACTLQFPLQFRHSILCCAALRGRRVGNSKSQKYNNMAEGLMKDLEAFRKAQRADGPAMILAIGTATPPNAVDQSSYPDYYFKITNSEHMTELKEKFRRMCDKSAINKRYMYLTEEILKENPKVCEYMAPSLDARQDMVVVEVPRLGKEAAAKAIKEWGQPKSKITHVIFCTTSGVDMPGADYQLTKLLGLRPSVKRVMMYQQGCFAGGTVLRVAKDLAENNRGARVLVVCSEITAVTFRGPSDTHLDSMVGQALFGDGAAALIVGADPIPQVEKPCFELLWTAQTILPDSDGAIDGHLREVGLTFHLLKDVPGLISKNIEKSLLEAFQQFGISDWNQLFWIAHPGGPAILDQVEAKLNLDPKKLRATRQVLSEYGNMSSACVHFILDEMRKSSQEKGCSTTGEGLDVGVLFGFGPGLTVETVVLKSVPL